MRTPTKTTGPQQKVLLQAWGPPLTALCSWGILSVCWAYGPGLNVQLAVSRSKGPASGLSFTLCTLGEQQIHPPSLFVQLRWITGYNTAWPSRFKGQGTGRPDWALSWVWKGGQEFPTWRSNGAERIAWGKVQRGAEARSGAQLGGGCGVLGCNGGQGQCLRGTKEP